jgi:hypothetical protein
MQKLNYTALPPTMKRNSTTLCGHEGASLCVANSGASLLYMAMSAQNGLHGHQVALSIEKLLGE